MTWHIKTAVRNGDSQDLFMPSLCLAKIPSSGTALAQLTFYPFGHLSGSSSMLYPFWVQAMTTGISTTAQGLVHPNHYYLILNYCNSPLFLATLWNVVYTKAGMILLKYKSNHITPVVSHHSHNKILIVYYDLAPATCSSTSSSLLSLLSSFQQPWLSCCSSNTPSSQNALPVDLTWLASLDHSNHCSNDTSSERSSITTLLKNSTHTPPLNAFFLMELYFSS